MVSSSIKERIKIWKGLENFRQIILDLLAHDIKKINQNTLDRLFPDYGFLIHENRRNLLIKEVGPFKFEMEFNPEEVKTSGEKGAYVKVLNIFN